MSNVSPPDFSPFDFFPISENGISQLSTRAVVQLLGTGLGLGCGFDSAGQTEPLLRFVQTEPIWGVTEYNFFFHHQQAT